MPLPQRSTATRTALVVVALGAAVLITGCKGGASPSWLYASQAPAASGGTSAPASNPPSAAATTAPTAAASPAASSSAFARNPAEYVEGATYSQTIDPADFVEQVSHPFMPLQADSTWVYDGDEHVEVTVLPDTKVILGVTVTVVHDQVFVDGELAEDTLDWFAQDRDGNVWYFGERIDEYERGRLVGHEGQWLAGEHGAKPGLFMPAAPKVGAQFAQERAPGVAEDRTTVLAVGLRVRTPARVFTGCIKVRDFSPLDRTNEFKYYCPGVGIAREVEPPGARFDVVSFG
jgi:hypothetical protein